MDILGHCYLALKSGLYTSEEVYGEGLLDLMLPNILHCHDWAYANIWHIEKFPVAVLPAARLVQSHIVADWVIHYGAESTEIKKKCGWAYRRMAVAKNNAERFFGNAARMGLLAPWAENTQEWDKRKRLDFSHSIIEYCLDLILASRIAAADFLRMKSVLSSLAGTQGSERTQLLFARFADLGAWSDHNLIFLNQSVEAFARDGVRAESPDHFAISTVIRKYGFVDTDASYGYVRDFLHEIASTLELEDVENMLDGIADAVANPALIYTGTLKQAETSALGGGRHE